MQLDIRLIKQTLLEKNLDQKKKSEKFSLFFYNLKENSIELRFFFWILLDHF